MARKQDVKAAAKARKQKLILIVGGVALLALGAIQAPKLLKHGSSPTTEAAATTVTESSPNVIVAPGAPTGSPTAGSAIAGTSPGTVAVASLAGVQIRNAGAPAVDDGQLWSFSVFVVKDPFVPQGAAKPPAETTSTPAAKPASTPAVTEPPPPTTPVEPTPPPVPVQTTPVETTPVETTPVQTTPVETTPVETTPVETTPVPTTPAPEPPPPPPVPEPVATVPEPVVPPKPAFATIEVNGAAQHLAPGDIFPKLAQVFVLVSLKEETARIGVAGGSFSGGKTAGLQLGKSLTAVDRATGVRYVLKLVYLGPEPEVVKAFTSGSEKQPASETQPAPETQPAASGK